MKWQLWCYYEYADIWKMEGFFYTFDEAERQLNRLRDDEKTPSMSDFEYVKVEVK